MSSHARVWKLRESDMVPESKANFFVGNVIMISYDTLLWNSTKLMMIRL